MPDLETSLELCTFCPRLCSHTCPVSLTSGRETLTPQAKMSRFGALRDGPAIPPGSATAAVEPLYGCTGCGACTTACLHGVEPANALMRGRAEAQRAFAGHPALLDLPERQRQRAQEAARSLKRDEQLVGRFAIPGEVALLPSCLPRGEGGPATEARAMLRVVDRLREVQPALPNIGVAVVASPGGCAGYPLYAGGFAESFKMYAEQFARSIESYSTLAVSCSACTWLLRTQYREHGVPLRPEIVHTSELLAPFAASLPIVTEKRLPAATYLDPCHLGRRLGCYEPPRQLLRRAVETLHELPTHHGAPEARCCGAGGLLPTTDPALAAEMARERVAELPTSTGPVISGCPACSHHIDKSGAASGQRSSQIHSKTLFEILDQATTP